MNLLGYVKKKMVIFDYGLAFKIGSFKWFKLLGDFEFEVCIFSVHLSFCDQYESNLMTEKLTKHCFLVPHYAKDSLNSIAC